MVGGFPCESLLSFSRRYLLNFYPGDITQAMSNQTLEPSVCAAGANKISRVAYLECRQYSPGSKQTSSSPSLPFHLRFSSSRDEKTRHRNSFGICILPNRDACNPIRIRF